MALRHPSRFVVTALLAGWLLGFIACTQDSAPAGPAPEAKPVSLHITGATRVAVGSTVNLAAVVLDAQGDTLRNVMVAWSNPDSARFSLLGVAAMVSGKAVSTSTHVTAKRTGSVRLTASLGSLQDTLTVHGYLPGVAFVFDDTVPQVERLRIQDAAQDALDFQRQVFDKAIPDSVTLSGVYAGQGCASGGAAAFASGRAITFCLGNQGWKAHGPVIKQKIVQHELFHLWQFAHWSADPAKSPAWLIEGSAELMGYHGVAQRGFLSFETGLGCQRKESADFAVNQPPGLPALQNVETRQVFQTTVGPLYTHSMLGAHYLAESGDGLASLEKYGDLVKTSASWQTAFEQAFKMTPTSFYGAFPAYVSGLAVPPTYACRL